MRRSTGWGTGRTSAASLRRPAGRSRAAHEPIPLPSATRLATTRREVRRGLRKALAPMLVYNDQRERRPAGDEQDCRGCG